VVTTAAPLLALAVAAMLAGAWRARSETAAGGGQRLG
jgi:hypothetical protein